MLATLRYIHGFSGYSRLKRLDVKEEKMLLVPEDFFSHFTSKVIDVRN